MTKSTYSLLIATWDRDKKQSELSSEARKMIMKKIKDPDKIPWYNFWSWCSKKQSQFDDADYKDVESQNEKKVA